MYKKILVPVGSACGHADKMRKTLERAREICAGEIVLLHVCEPVADTLEGKGREEVENEMKNTAMLLLEPFARELEKSKTPFQTRIEFGTVAEIIVQTADTENADLIIMRADCREDLKDLVLGSVTERVLRNAGTDLLALRG